MNAMRATPSPADVPGAAVAARGFAAFDACHRKTIALLDELAALVAMLELDGLEPQTCASAARIAAFFSTTAREHHEDEERHLFPALLKSARPEIVQAVVRLQQDHDRLEEAWFDLAPHVMAVAAHRSTYDIDVLRDGVPVLTALYLDHIELEEAFIHPHAHRCMPVPAKR
jgi:iron-sulfur cluster repair protein YtfE (RIC family)